MAFTLSAADGNISISTFTSLSLTITIPANAAVGLLAGMTGPNAVGYFAGTVTDSASNVYTAAGGANVETFIYTDAFYCLNTGSSATTITYTPNAAYSGLLSSISFAAWVWTITGGTATFGSQSSNGQSAPGTGTDAVTSGSVTCAAGSVIMGFSQNRGGTGPVTAGTGFTTDYNNGSFKLISEHGAFSSSQGATFTTATGTDPQLGTQGMSFGQPPANSASICWVT